MYGLRTRGVGTYINWPICGKSGQPMVPSLPKPGFSISRGLGCACGCGTCQNRGLGYFDTGWDISGWGWMEWGTVLLGAYIVMSTFSTTKRGYKRATGTLRRARRRSTEKRRVRLQREIEALG